MKVLIVEDDALVLFALESVFNSSGFSTVSAQDGVKASKLFLADVGITHVITDLDLPGMDGFELTRFIKGRRVGTRVCMFSANASENWPDLARKAGVDNTLRKPAGKEEILAALGLLT